jgi:hypothetical protein
MIKDTLKCAGVFFGLVISAFLLCVLVDVLAR